MPIYRVQTCLDAPTGTVNSIEATSEPVFVKADSAEGAMAIAVLRADLGVRARLVACGEPDPRDAEQRTYCVSSQSHPAHEHQFEVVL